MNITINRTHTNHLYTQGILVINDRRTTHTVESTQTMLPPGQYTLKIVKQSQRKQKLSIFSNRRPTPWTIGIGLTWIGSGKESIIAIGEPLIPGIVYKATPVYNRLVDRLSKCQARHEPIHLTITDTKCQATQPMSHWLGAEGSR